MGCFGIMELSNTRKKELRTIGHSLKPIITIAERGVTETIATELERALDDHELLKIKININDADARHTIVTTLCEQHRAGLVQSIGKIALLYRAAKKPNSKLSNLLRPA
jgi:RNA-binding protein